MTNAAPTLESLKDQQTTFSSLYESADAATYAMQVDEATLMADFQAASARFAADEDKIGECAHQFPAFINEVKKSDEKINAALGKKPAIIARLIQSEKLNQVFQNREAVHKVLRHS